MQWIEYIGVLLRPLFQWLLLPFGPHLGSFPLSHLYCIGPLSFSKNHFINFLICKLSSLIMESCCSLSVSFMPTFRLISFHRSRPRINLFTLELGTLSCYSFIWLTYGYMCQFYWLILYINYTVYCFFYLNCIFFSSLPQNSSKTPPFQRDPTLRHLLRWRFS